MDIERVKTIASDPKRTRKELEQMRENAIARKNGEAQHCIEAVLRERLPPQVGTHVMLVNRSKHARWKRTAAQVVIQ